MKKRPLLIISLILLLSLTSNGNALEISQKSLVITTPPEFVRGSIGLMNEEYRFKFTLNWPEPDTNVNFTGCVLYISDRMPDSSFERLPLPINKIEVINSVGNREFPIKINIPGDYWLHFILACDNPGGGFSAYGTKQLTIASQSVYTNFKIQDDELRLLKEQSNDTRSMASATKWLAILTGLLAISTFLMAIFSYKTRGQMAKDREVELLRKRLGHLYSMLKWHSNIIIRPFKPPIDLDDPQDYRVKFFRDFRNNLYLGSDKLIEMSKEYFGFVDRNKIRIDEEGTFYELRNKLADQIDEDYNKYLNKLMELTSRKQK